MAGQRVLITGGTSGLGIAIAARFAREGAAVAVVGRNAERGADAARRAGAHLVLADLVDETGCEAAIREGVSALGGLSVLVNNARAYAAGFAFAQPADEPREYGFDGSVADVTWAAADRILRVGALSAIRLSGLAVRHLIEAGGGAIVNVSSRAAARGTPGHAAYAASKAALESLALSITADFGRQGVRCNTVRPGYIVHEGRDAHLGDADRARLEASQVTRLVTAEDVAAAVVFLAGPDSEVISGVALPVDGGSSSLRGQVVG